VPRQRCKPRANRRATAEEPVTRWTQKGVGQIRRTCRQRKLQAGQVGRPKASSDQQQDGSRAELKIHRRVIAGWCFIRKSYEWKSESAQKCVTTYLPNEPAPKMDDV